MPPSDPEGRMMWVVEKYTRALLDGIVSAEEYANRLIVEFASDKRSLTHLAPEMVKVIPAEVIPAFTRMVLSALRPEYRHPAWFIGGRPDTRTADELARESDMLTARVKAWASALHVSLLRNSLAE